MPPFVSKLLGLHKEFEKVVQEAWIKRAHTINGKLNNVKNDTLAFNRNVFGHIAYRKHKVEVCLKGLPQSLAIQDSKSLKRPKK